MNEPTPEAVEAAANTDREPITHELKTWQSYFHAVFDGSKNFEIRRDDRGFRPGDWLRLRETFYHDGSYTGREITRRISYILRHEEDLGLREGFAILSLEPLTAAYAVDMAQAIEQEREACAEVAEMESDAWAKTAKHWDGYPEGSAEMEKFDRCLARGKRLMTSPPQSAPALPIRRRRRP